MSSWRSGLSKASPRGRDHGGKEKEKVQQSTLSIITRLQLLDVMLGSVQGGSDARSYAILYLDGFTTQVMSNICGISDLLDYGTLSERRRRRR